MPAAARPLPLDALRRLIADNDYWNPHSAQHQELRRKVSEGFGRLYPVNGDSAESLGMNRDQIDDGSLNALQRRHKEVWDEYHNLRRDNAPTPGIFDEDGNIIQDYVPVPPEIQKRLDYLDHQERRLRNILEELNAVPGRRSRMKNK